tara:strand:- start:83 stop:652 length:570 start_codon:yes stop_codon:yes gene_type:complete
MRNYIKDFSQFHRINEQEDNGVKIPFWFKSFIIKRGKSVIVYGDKMGMQQGMAVPNAVPNDLAVLEPTDVKEVYENLSPNEIPMFYLTGPCDIEKLSKSCKIIYENAKSGIVSIIYEADGEIGWRSTINQAMRRSLGFATKGPNNWGDILVRLRLPKARTGNGDIEQTDGATSSNSRTGVQGELFGRTW